MNKALLELDLLPTLASMLHKLRGLKVVSSDQIGQCVSLLVVAD